MPIARLPRHIRAVALVALILPAAAFAQSGAVEQPAPPPVVQTDMAVPGAAPQSDTLPALPAPVAPVPGLPEAASPVTTVPGLQAPPVAAAETASPAPILHDLSPWGMFMAAHVVVKAVMVSLAIACFLTWTVLLFKLVEVALARLRARRSSRVIRDAGSLAAASDLLARRRDPAAFMARAALAEYRRSDPVIALAGPEGVKERTRSILERVEAQAGSRLRRGTGLLATIGSTAPFVGLFGTVWGIMNSFIGIAESQTTNLAVVAPGIAEALLATAIGLVAAIPAVVIYNHFARAIAGYRLILGDAGAGVERLLSRDLDFRKAERLEG